MKRIITCVFLFLTLLAGCGVSEIGIKYAGVRSSSYGIRPFPDPSGWEKSIRAMCGYFQNSTPCAIWIVGVLERPKSCRLEFPSEGKEYTNTTFLDYDKHEPYLDYFDKKGIKVFLQVEPANADVENLIDLVLNRYKHHRCVIGFGIDVEWHKEFDNPQWGVPVDDYTAEKWEKRVKRYNPSYRLFLKHWDRRWMPPRYRGDIFFISDSQQLGNREKMLEEFVVYWADFFKPNPVGFQVGYPSDYTWWGKLKTPPKDIGIALAKRIQQECSIFWVDFSLRRVLPTDDRLVGVKIYDYDKDFRDLFEQWESLGINAAFVSESLALKKEFMDLAKKYHIAVFVILPTFYNPAALEKDPALFAVTGEGKKAKQDWVEFVCPTREDYRKQHLELIKKIIKECDPDGISIDFARYFVYWEMVYPGMKLNPLHNSCFCPDCLDKMQKDLDFKIPAELDTVPKKAEWILKNHKEKWVEWKCGTITSMIKEIVSEAKKVKPGILSNVHIVPWRRQDFGNALRLVAAQDIAAISSYVDYVSPMCYAHMVKQKPAWIHSVVKDFGEQTCKNILPSIQVKTEYLEEALSLDEFKESLQEALKAPSLGVVFWNWKGLAEDPEKPDAAKTILKEN
jgi:hypothetical protein